MKNKNRSAASALVALVALGITSIMVLTSTCRQRNKGSTVTEFPGSQSSGPTQKEIATQVAAWYNSVASVQLFDTKISPTTVAELLSVKPKETKQIDGTDVQVTCDLSFKMKYDNEGGENTPLALLVGLGFETSPAKKDETKTLEGRFDFVKVDGSWRLEMPRALTPEDGLQCGMRIATLRSTFGGLPQGELKGFECTDKSGKAIQIELASNTLIGGMIGTKQFGTIRVRSEGLRADYYMTDSQIRKIRERVGVAGTPTPAKSIKVVCKCLEAIQRPGEDPVCIKYAPGQESPCR